MATHTTYSQTCALGTTNPPLSPRYNPFSVFRSSCQGPELVNQFQSFSPHCTPTSTSQARPSLHFPTLGVRIVELSNDAVDDSSHHLGERSFCIPPNNNGPLRGPNDPRDDPSNGDSDDLDDLFTDPNNDEDEDEDEQVLHDILTQLVSAIHSLARSSHHPTSDLTPCTNVCEPDQFDRTDPCKL